MSCDGMRGKGKSSSVPAYKFRNNANSDPTQNEPVITLHFSNDMTHTHSTLPDSDFTPHFPPFLLLFPVFFNAKLN